MKRTHERSLLVRSLAFGTCAVALVAACGGTASSSAEETGSVSEALSGHRGFNRRGNILISDQFNNRVVEIDPSGRVVWQFGLGPTDLSPNSLIGVNDAQRVGSLTLAAGTGVPAAEPPLEPGLTDGFADNRVVLIDEAGKIVWQYGQFGVTGSGDNELNTPVQATFLPNDDIFIADQGNQRIIEVSVFTKKIVWQYGQTGLSGVGADQLNNPNSAELLANGHVLIADENNNRAIEVDRAKNIVATFTAGGTVSGAAFASRLVNGDTLITDSNNSRIVEVDKSDNVVWQYLTNGDPNSNSAPLPTRAVRLRNGNTLISDQFNDRVIEVDPAKDIVKSYGALNVSGYDANNVAKSGLAAPYDAKVVGDYTGLTPPFGRDFD
ncbi:MAG TPA: PQQ-binding-like beta-propeller repeat protein [Polyangiaceae bacterium]|nr:PQQ-binding-like beta-propeller repeat protein [Polyangiaceae bacterium]